MHLGLYENYIKILLIPYNNYTTLNKMWGLKKILAKTVALRV